MGQNYTFAEAYIQQVKLRESATMRLSQTSERIGEDEVSDILIKVATVLQEELSPVVLKSIKSRLKQLPLACYSLVGSWVDDDGLDLLHHSIINNCPEMVEFLLSEPQWFPSTQMPKKNPYAHLAAIFGFTECLRLIMQYRPGDYFTGSNQSHVIKLPPSIRKRLKSLDSLRTNANKQMEKLLHRIKSSTEWTENSMKSAFGNVVDMEEVGNVLKSELEELEKNKTKHDASIHRFRSLTLSGTAPEGYKRVPAGEAADNSGKSTRLQAVGASSLEVKSLTQDTLDKKTIARQTTDKVEKIKCDKRQKLKLCGRGAMVKHRLTVDWDVFSQLPAGVVSGAGDKVIVTYTDNSRKERQEASVFDTLHKSGIMGTLRTLPSKEGKTSENRKTLKRKSTIRGIAQKKDSSLSYPKVLEPGVRGKKKYKDFKLTLEQQTIKDDTTSLKNKTPLSIAAQYGHLECVQMILDTFILKNHPHMAVREPLTLATKAKSPEAIVLLMGKKLTRTDYQSAVLTAIREMYPDCLTALLVHKTKEKQSLFDGVNLYHILYTQSLMSDYRYEMLPIMTNVLINSNEDVNAHNVYCTYPLYTLINCSFNISIGKQIFYYVECVKILLENKASPHFDETEAFKLAGFGQSFSRSAYSSAINCILESAMGATNFFEHAQHSKIFMKKLITTVTTCDKTNRRLLNDVLFNYMDTVNSLDLDRYIVRCLLRYGANPDFRNGSKYAINVYFDKMLPHLAKFEVNSTHSKWQHELSALMLVCRGMNYKCLREAKIIFLNEHLLRCPIQALPLCRYFSYLINDMLTSPRPLVELVAQFIWVRLRRNEKRAKMLPLPDPIISLIVP
ncbi:unnamed protein product [Candidula unifasciata]|uniref:Uncharacterized protein n=1 Tax=Candidula unifasciata TaxID=100452 RepID=A0A8S3ZFF1_9EUPU|nr:unnamed protein product [Candidula unifasciata]